MITRRNLECSFRGPVPYLEGIRLMEAAASDLVSGGGTPRLLMFEHPPTITSGIRGTTGSLLIAREELVKEGVEFHPSDRGGDLTWHGPGQLVGYPVVSLSELGIGVPAFIHAMEAALISWLGGQGLECYAIEGRPGVWISPESKLASMGVAIRRGVTTHGFALNLSGPLYGSEFITPCGLGGVRLVSLDEYTGRRLKPIEAARGVAGCLGDALGLRILFTDWNTHC